MLLADALSRAYLEDYERSVREVEVESIHATVAFFAAANNYIRSRQ